MLNILKLNKIIKNLFVIFFISFVTYGENIGDDYLGYWLLPNKKVVIEIVKDENDKYVGYVRWLKESVYPIGDIMEGKEQIDRNNPDIFLRQRKVMGLQVVGDLIKNENNQLIDGWVYDTWNGKKYYGFAKIIDHNHIKLKGSIDKWNIIGYSMIIERVDIADYK